MMRDKAEPKVKAVSSSDNAETASGLFFAGGTQSA